VLMQGMMLSVKMRGGVERTNLLTYNPRARWLVPISGKERGFLRMTMPTVGGLARDGQAIRRWNVYIQRFFGCCVQLQQHLNFNTIYNYHVRRYKLHHTRALTAWPNVQQCSERFLKAFDLIG